MNPSSDALPLYSIRNNSFSIINKGRLVQQKKTSIDGLCIF